MSRKRVMYVVGRALDLEYSLRGMAVAKEDGVYESHLFALDDGRLLLIYIKQQKKKLAELVSDVLRCKATI